LNLGLSIACGLFSAGTFGTADFIAKLSTNKIGFLRTALFMQIIGSFFVLPFAIMDSGRLLTYPSIAVAAALLGGINALATLCLYKSFEIGRLSIVSPVASTAPCISILLAVTFLGEILTLPILVGVGSVMVGIVLVTAQKGESGPKIQVAKGTVYAVGFMLLGGLLLFAIKPVSSVLGPFLSVLILRWGSVPVLMVPYLRRRSSDRRSSALKLISGVAFFDTVANLAYIFGLNFGTVTIVAPLAGLASSVTVLLAWAILKEKLSRHNLAGLIAIAFGVGMLGTFG